MWSIKTCKWGSVPCWKKIQQFHEHIDLIGEPVIRQLLEEKLEEEVMKRTKTQEKISKGFMRVLVQKLKELQDQI